MMRYFFICNPGSRGGASARQVDRIMEAARRAGARYERQDTTSLAHARELATAAARAGYDVIVAVGGDGTINQVLSGLYRPDGTRIGDAALGVIHTGTSPDFSKARGIPTTPHRALRAVLNGRIVKISVGRVARAIRFEPDYAGRGVDDSPLFHTGFFGCCVNIGMGAQVARAANSGLRKRYGDTAGTLLAVLRALAAHRPMELRVRRDHGSEETIRGLYNLFIGKTDYVASGIKVYNELRPDDERCYNLGVTNVRLDRLPGCLRDLYSGRPIKNSPLLNLNYSRTIEILGTGASAEIEYDGDPGGFLPCRIDTARDRLRLITE